jgi:hypothetical protein
MKLADAVRTVAAHGRGGDSTLMHIQPHEVQALAHIIPNGVTQNPQTGLPEAFDLAGLLGSALGGIGDLLGGAVGGITDLVSPDLTNALGLGSAPAEQSTTGFGGSSDGSSVGGAKIASGINRNQSFIDALPSNAGSTSSPSDPSWLDKNWPAVVKFALPTIAMLGQHQNKPPALPLSAQQANNYNTNATVPNFTFQRQPFTGSQNPSNWYHAGSTGAPLFFANPGGTYQQHARGGPIHDGGMAELVYPHGGIHGPGGGQDDDVPARLSNGEYVMDATTVADLGDGSSEVGEQRMDELRHAIQASKGRKEVVPGKAKSPHHYLKLAKAA